MLEALIFDVDGTLAETEEMHRLAFNAAFAASGLPDHWSREDYAELVRITGGKERLRAWFARTGRPELESRIPDLHRAKTVQYRVRIGEGAQVLRPGVLRLMRAARDEGLKVALATTTTGANIDALLQPVFGVAWQQRFDAIFAGDAVPRKKPAPDVYHACLAALGVDAGRAIAIEDSRNGVDAARAAGLAVIVTPSEYSRLDDFSQADLCLPSLGDPQAPWREAHPPFAQRWVEIADLRRWLAMRASATA